MRKRDRQMAMMMLMMMQVVLVAAVDVMQVLEAGRWTNQQRPVCFLYEANTHVCMDDGCHRSVNCG